MPEIASLTFVSGRDFWVVTPSGNWSEDNSTGREMAVSALALMRKRSGANLLGSVVKSMIEHGKYGGVEAGFLTTIASAALRAD